MGDYIELLRNSGPGPCASIIDDLIALRAVGDNALADVSTSTAAAFQLKAGERLTIVSRMYSIAKLVRAEQLGV